MEVAQAVTLKHSRSKDVTALLPFAQCLSLDVCNERGLVYRMTGLFLF